MMTPTPCVHRSAVPIERLDATPLLVIYACANHDATPAGQTTPLHCSICSHRPDSPARVQRPPQPPPAPPSPLTLIQLWNRFRVSMRNWREAGYPIAPRSVLWRRAKTCYTCEYRRAAICAHPGCGCTALKLVVATESCPAGKWAAVVITNTISTNPPSLPNPTCE